MVPRKYDDEEMWYLDAAGFNEAGADGAPEIHTAGFFRRHGRLLQ